METENKISPENDPGTKKVYTAPIIEIVEVMVERGFQISGESDDLSDPDGSGSY